MLLKQDDMKRPNILILFTDQQRWDALGFNGNNDIKTPNLDRLASEGVSFDHYFIQNPVCMPSRVSFLTGQYPSRLGITHMGVPVPEDTLTLPRLLENYGYRSANIGKLHFLPHANRDHTEVHPDYGFDHLEISDEPGCYEDAYRAWVRKVAPDQLDYVSVGLPPATEIWQRLMGKDNIKHPEERFPKKAIAHKCKSEVTHTAFVADQTIEFIRGQRDNPFLCIAGFYSPHSPWIAPQECLDRYDPKQLSLPEFPPDVDARRRDDHFSDAELRSARHGYYAMVTEVDNHVGRTMDFLDEQGLAENTLVIFTSDHGEWLGEHLKYGKGYPGSDCVSRVPLICRMKGAGRQGERLSNIVEGVDVVPTILECAGIPIPPHLQGKSLWNQFNGGDAKSSDGALMEMKNWKSLRTERYRYVSEANGKETLIDLENDPGEYQNLADSREHSEELADMRANLLKKLIRVERPLPRAWVY